MNEIITGKIENNSNILKEINNDLLPKKFGIKGKVFVTVLILLCLVGLFAYIKQLKYGLGVTAMRDYVSWGVYIAHFVFLVAVSLVGSLITAILFLLKVKWRSSLTRLAEIIAVASIICAGCIIIVDMGRPERLLNIFIYGRIQSPIVWDVIVVMTYMTISLLLLYFPMLPGLAICRDNMVNIPKWQRKMYKILSLGWKGTEEQFNIVEKAIKILSILIIPVALTIHTVTSWLFASTVRPGWDSTNLGPYFVAGAFVAGAAAVIMGMFILIKSYPNYKKYITNDHFDKMGKLLVLLLLIYLYFNVNEYFVPGYKMKSLEGDHMRELISGKFSLMFWSVQIIGMIIPICLLIFKRMRKALPIFYISIIVLIAAWFKRFLIVIPSLLNPYTPMQGVPESFLHYIPTWEELMITIASISVALLIITIFIRFFPAISIWEAAADKGIKNENILKFSKLDSDEK